MAKAIISIDPVTRIEGHLKAEVTVEHGKVVDARMYGGMYRGFETILQGRDPRDATQIVQRICGVCPTSHANASVVAQENAFYITIPENARVSRNLILGANFLQSHLLHFYHLAALDFVNGPETSPFVPRFTRPDVRLTQTANSLAVEQYIAALEVRRIAHEMVALFGGRMPHVQGIVTGGTSQMPTAETLDAYIARFTKVKNFITQQYVPLVYAVASQYKDLFAQGQGYKNCMSFGAFPLDAQGESMLMCSGVYIDGQDQPLNPGKISEDVRFSWFAQETSGRNFVTAQTIPDLHKDDAYSFVKAPRYGGQSVEVGPVARMWIHNTPLSSTGQSAIRYIFGINAYSIRDIGAEKVFSIMGRHMARAEEALLIATAMQQWLSQIQTNEPTWHPVVIPREAEGFACTEAPRGALLHYVRVEDKKIAAYQIIPATMWNCGPRDDQGARGTVEQALVHLDVPDTHNPVNIGRLIRAFDP